MGPRSVRGDDLLYRFFLDLLAQDDDGAAEIARLMVQSLAIWLPLDIYRDWPILLPWVVRDPSCRGSKAKGLQDAWSAPDADGYLRDDNSLVKSLPRSLAVRGPSGSHVHGTKMGTEFVASHIWRRVNHEMLASRIPLLNSFVPNLVWLPRQVAKLSDLEGDIIQTTLQATARAIYEPAPVAAHLREPVDEAWQLLPPPKVRVSPNLEALNWFVATPAFFATRTARLSIVIKALETLGAGGTLDKKVISTRYTEGLPDVPQDRRSMLLDHLMRFASPRESISATGSL